MRQRWLVVVQVGLLVVFFAALGVLIIALAAAFAGAEKGFLGGVPLAPIQTAAVAAVVAVATLWLLRPRRGMPTRLLAPRGVPHTVAEFEKTVARLRPMAQRRPNSDGPQLARMLRQLSSAQYAGGQVELALAGIDEAIALHEEVGIPGLELARALQLRARCLQALGRTADAVATYEQYIALLRESRDKAVPQLLAEALITTTALLTDLGRTDDAVAAAEEAVELRRKASPPDAAKLAMALNVNALLLRLSVEPDVRAEDAEGIELGGPLSPAGYPHFTTDQQVLTGMASLAALDEAIVLYRQLGEPVLSRLGDALHRQAKLLRELERPGDALAPMAEYLTIYARLAERAPAEYQPDLSHGYHHRGVDLAIVGRYEEAVASVTRSVELYRELNGRAEPRLAEALDSLAEVYALMGRAGEAATAEGEAAAVRQQLRGASSGEVGIGEVGIGGVGIGGMGIGEVGISGVGIGGVGIGKANPDEIGPDAIDRDEIGHGEIGPGEAGPDEGVAPGE
jgi:tetratricopeptide (TPR) repeat protein